MSIAADNQYHSPLILTAVSSTATLIVVDRVGNERTQTVTFDVVTHHDRTGLTDGVG